MSWLGYFRRKRRAREIEDEIESYIAISIEDNIAAGMTEEQARSVAHRKFGNITLIKETVRDMNSVNWLEDLWNDMRHGARLLKLNPSFFVVATLSLALGIGANTAIFQLLNAVRLRALPVSHPEQLAQLQIAQDEHCCFGSFSTRHSDFTNAQWIQIHEHQKAFSAVAAFADDRFNLNERGEARWAEGLWVSGSYFRTLGVRPAAGRLLSDADDHPGCGSAGGAVISYPFWQREFGGGANAVGSKISLNGHPAEIIGVTAAGFFGTEVGRSFDVAAPICEEASVSGENSRIGKGDNWWLAILGRLEPGWTVARAAAQSQAISKQVFESTLPHNFTGDAAKYYSSYKLTALAAASGVSELRSDYEDPLWLLLGIAGAVLLIACANLANLMLARASVREREMAVRIAIGAGGGRLIRQLLAEAALLTLAGLTAGALMAQWLSRYLVSFISTADNRLFLDLGIDWRILGFTSLVGVVTCVLSGIAPALRAAGTSPGIAMKAGGRTVTADRSRFGLRRALVVVQVALSLVLLTGALLFGRSLRNLTTLDTGLNEAGLMIVQVDASNANVPVERREALYEALRQRMLATPGVEHAAYSAVVPLSGSSMNPPVDVVGTPLPAQHVNVWLDRVSLGYFETMGIPLLMGRDFTSHDTPGSPPVALVTRNFQDKFLNGANPVGRQLHIPTGPGEAPLAFEIVGVVRDVQYKSLAARLDPVVFTSQSQEKHPWNGISFLIGSHAAAGPLTAALRKAFLEENGSLTFQFKGFETQVHDSILRERLMAALSGFFGLLAALLASVGLYGVISYMVARRRNEIGIRVALGASRSSIVQLVFQEAAVLLAVGMAVGLALTLGGLRVTSALLYGLGAHDPLTITMAVALLAAVSLFASVLPAVRASRLDPIDALREE